MGINDENEIIKLPELLIYDRCDKCKESFEIKIKRIVDVIVLDQIISSSIQDQKEYKGYIPLYRYIHICEKCALQLINFMRDFVK